MVCFLGIGDCGSKTVTKLDITNQVETAITNSNKVINDVVNDTINNVSTELTNNVSSTISIDTGSYNNFTVDTLDVEASTANIQQTAQTDAQSIAAQQIASNQQSIDDLTNSIISSLQNKVTNNNDLNLAMQTLSQLNNISKNAGGPEHIVDSIMDALQKTLSGGDSTDDETTFKNLIGVTDINQNDFESSMKNIISTSVSGKITSNTFGNMNLDSSSSNKITVRNLTVKDKDGIEGHFNLSQDASLDSFEQAIISLQLGSGISNKILTDTSISALTDALNATKEEAKNDSNTIVVNKNIQGSAIMDFLNNLNPLNLLKSLGTYAVIVIVIIIILVAIFFIFFILPHMFKKSSTSSAVSAPSTNINPT
jgi:hypothetical protein